LGVAADANNLYISEYDNNAVYHDKIAHVTITGPGTIGSITEVPCTQADTAPEGLAAAADGKVYFYGSDSEALHQYDPSTMTINPSSALLPSAPNDAAFGVTMGPNDLVTGNPTVWLADFGVALGSVDKLFPYVIDGMPLRAGGSGATS